MGKFAYMPLKWRIYYLCCLYMLLWSITLLFVLCYGVIRTRFSTETLLYAGIILAILAIPVFKSILAIRGLNHYKNGTLQSKAERKTFVVSFCLVALFAIGCLMLCIFEIIPQDFMHHPNSDYIAHRDYPEMVLDYATFLLTICSLLVAASDLFLLKAIHKKYYDSLIVLGESIGEHLEV